MTHPRSRSIAALTTLTLLSPVALAGGPALSGMSAQADSAETAISNPAGMARLDEATFTVRTVVGEGLGEFKVDENRTTTVVPPVKTPPPATEPHIEVPQL